MKTFLLVLVGVVIGLYGGSYVSAQVEGVDVAPDGSSLFTPIEEAELLSEDNEDILSVVSSTRVSISLTEQLVLDKYSLRDKLQTCEGQRLDLIYMLINEK